MSYSVIPSERFKKEAKRLIKKYPSLKSELMEFNNEVSLNPNLGTALGNNTFKIRIAIKSKGEGKSGGARIITYIITRNIEVYLLTIYDKSEFDIVDDGTLKSIIAQINNNEAKG